MSPAQQCTGGKVFDAASNVCKCPPSTAWNGTQCLAAPISCAGGKVFDKASNTCKCPASKTWDGTKCK